MTLGDDWETVKILIKTVLIKIATIMAKILYCHIIVNYTTNNIISIALFYKKVCFKTRKVVKIEFTGRFKNQAPPPQN